MREDFMVEDDLLREELPLRGGQRHSVQQELKLGGKATWAL